LSKVSGSEGEFGNYLVEQLGEDELFDLAQSLGYDKISDFVAAFKNSIDTTMQALSEVVNNFSRTV